MADRVDFYFRQRVTEAELDLACELLEQADRDLAADIGIYGIVSGAAPTQHSPVPDLTVDPTSPTRAYDRLGQRIFIGSPSPWGSRSVLNFAGLNVMSPWGANRKGLLFRLCSSDSLCGRRDDVERGDCLLETPPYEIRFLVDADVSEDCVNVTVLVDDEASAHILNLNDDGCASGTLGTIPIAIRGEKRSLENTVVRMTLTLLAGRAPAASVRSAKGSSGSIPQRKP